MNNEPHDPTKQPEQSREEENPFDADHLSAEEKLRNVASIVLRYTEVKRPSNGRRNPPTYAARVDAIALYARQLAEEVTDYLRQGPQQQPVVTAPQAELGPTLELDDLSVIIEALEFQHDVIDGGKDFDQVPKLKFISSTLAKVVEIEKRQARYEHQQEQQQHHEAVDKDLEHIPDNPQQELQRQTIIEEIWRVYGTEDVVDLAQRLFRARDEVDIKRLLRSHRQEVDLPMVHQLLKIPETQLHTDVNGGWAGVESGIARHFGKPAIDPVAEKKREQLRALALDLHRYEQELRQRAAEKYPDPMPGLERKIEAKIERLLEERRREQEQQVQQAVQDQKAQGRGMAQAL